MKKITFLFLLLIPIVNCEILPARGQLSEIRDLSQPEKRQKILHPKWKFYLETLRAKRQIEAFAQAQKRLPEEVLNFARKIPIKSEKYFVISTKKPGLLWLVAELDLEDFRDPILFIPQALLYLEVYYGQKSEKKIFSNLTEFRFQGSPAYFIPLPKSKRGQKLYLKIFSPIENVGVINPLIYEQSELLREMILDFTWLPGTFLFILGITLFFVSLYLWIRLQRSLYKNLKIYLILGLFTLSGGLWILTEGMLIDYFIAYSIVKTTLSLFFRLLFGLSFLLYVRYIFGDGPWNIIKKLVYFQLFYLPSAFFVLFTGIYQNWFLVIYIIFTLLDNFILTVHMLVTLIIIIQKTFQKDENARIFAVAFFIIISIGLRDLMGGLGLFDLDFILYPYGLIIFVIFMLGIAIRFQQFMEIRIIENEKNLSINQVELKKTQLRELQARMNPHFLLNALSMLYAQLQKKEYDKACGAILDLSDLYRYLSEEISTELVTLEQEILFCEKFLAIQKKRFQKKIEYNITQEADIVHMTKDIYLPPFTLQPLLENAFKHGLSQISDIGKIYINISHNNDTTNIYIVDNGPGFPEKINMNRSLGNIRSRLLYYYNKVELIAGNKKGRKGAEVLLSFGQKKHF